MANISKMFETKFYATEVFEEVCGFGGKEFLNALKFVLEDMPYSGLSAKKSIL